MRVLRFHADWCGPCKRVAPLVAAIAARQGVPVESIDIDEVPTLVERYSVQSVPTLVVLDDSDSIIYQGSGAGCLSDFQAALERP